MGARREKSYGYLWPGSLRETARGVRIVGMGAETKENAGGGAREIVLALFGSNLFALVVAGIYEYLSLRGIVNMMAAWVVLIFVWLIGVIAIVLSERVWGGSMKQRIITGVSAAVISAALLFGVNALVDRLVVPAQAKSSVPEIVLAQNQPEASSGSCNTKDSTVGGSINNNCNNTINQAPAPKVKIVEQLENANSGGTYSQNIHITIDSPYVAKSLTVGVKSKSVIQMDIVPDRGGVMFNVKHGSCGDDCKGISIR
jgi:hypothetical protein